MRVGEECRGFAAAARLSSAIILAWLMTYIAYDSYGDALSFLLLPQLLGLAVGVAAGVYARSLLAGYAAATLFLFDPASPDRVQAYSGYTLLLTLAIIGLLSYKRGLSDSAIEALMWRGRFRATPLLASASILSIYYFFDLSIIYNPLYLADAALAAVTAGRSAETLEKALASSIIASLGPLGLLGLTIYFAYKPLPPLNCGGLPLPGRLVAYEEEASSTRLLTRGRRWKDRGLACSTPSTPTLNVGVRSVVWAYSADPKGTALLLQRSLAPRGRLLLLDLDSISPCEGPSKRAEVVCLGDYPLVEVKAYLSSLVEKAKQYSLVVVYSCRVRPREIARELAMVASSTTVAASLCLPEEDALIASSGPDGGGVLFSMIGDPVLARTILGKMLGGGEEKLYYILRRSKAYLFYPYCGRRWALAET